MDERKCPSPGIAPDATSLFSPHVMLDYSAIAIGRLTVRQALLAQSYAVGEGPPSFQLTRAGQPGAGEPLLSGYRTTGIIPRCR